MKKIYKWLLVLFLLLTLVGMYSHNAIKKAPPIFYVPWLPGSLMAFTAPPLGIYIESAYKGEGDTPGTILAHERVHWLQYQERGLWGYYRDYTIGLVKHGRLYNEMEEDARERSK